MLFGKDYFEESLDSLDNIERISHKLAGEHADTMMRLVMNNTMYPLYRPFTSQGWQDFANSFVRPYNRRFLFKLPGGRKRRTKKKGMRSYFLEPVKGEQRFIRFCPACVSSDYSRYGEPYWHRSHQIYGINLCHKHGSPLVETTIETMYSNGNLRYALPDLTPKECVWSKPVESAMQRVAQTAYWLLNFKGDVVNVAVVKSIYAQLLAEKGYLLSENFNNLPFDLDGYCIKNNISNEPVKQLRYDTFIWIKSLVHRLSFDVHPLDHLIFMDYLGVSTKQLIFDQCSQD